MAKLKLRDRVLKSKPAGNKKFYQQERLPGGYFGRKNKNWLNKTNVRDFALCKSKLLNIKS